MSQVYEFGRGITVAQLDLKEIFLIQLVSIIFFLFVSLYTRKTSSAVNKEEQTSSLASALLQQRAAAGASSEAHEMQLKSISDELGAAVLERDKKSADLQKEIEEHLATRYTLEKFLSAFDKEKEACLDAKKILSVAEKERAHALKQLELVRAEKEAVLLELQTNQSLQDDVKQQAAQSTFNHEVEELSQKLAESRRAELHFELEHTSLQRRCERLEAAVKNLERVKEQDAGTLVRLKATHATQLEQERSGHQMALQTVREECMRTQDQLKVAWRQDRNQLSRSLLELTGQNAALRSEIQLQQRTRNHQASSYSPAHAVLQFRVGVRGVETGLIELANLEEPNSPFQWTVSLTIRLSSSPTSPLLLPSPANCHEILEFTIANRGTVTVPINRVLGSSVRESSPGVVRALVSCDDPLQDWSICLECTSVYQ